MPGKSRNGVTLRAAVVADLPAIAALLAEAGLPVADLDADKLANFQVAIDQHDVLASIGIERFGKVGLLRSLVVAKAQRGNGLGDRLVRKLEADAVDAGLTQMWLLTIDAQQYFQKLGYEIVDRALAPDCIRQTDEFSGLCPDDAYLMSRTL